MHPCLLGFWEADEDVFDIGEACEDIPCGDVADAAKEFLHGDDLQHKEGEKDKEENPVEGFDVHAAAHVDIIIGEAGEVDEGILHFRPVLFRR